MVYGFVSSQMALISWPLRRCVAVGRSPDPRDRQRPRPSWGRVRRAGETKEVSDERTVSVATTGRVA